ncbi:MAG: sensor histidine kinase, partial [Butyricicoccaceae bacterium]
MLKRLQIQFVSVVMVLVTVMLCAIFGLIYYFTAQNMERESISMMQSIATDPFRLGRPDNQSDDLRLPHFTLQIGLDGKVVGTGGGYYDLSDKDFLENLVAAVSMDKEPVGIVKDYNLRFLRLDTPNGQNLVFSDITSERSTLQNLARTCATIGVLCFFFFLGVSILLAKWMVQPVDRAWKQQRQFVSDASHELKTPLTIITTNAELLQNPDCAQATKDKYSGNILTMSNHMRNLVEHLLELARVDSDQNKLTCVPLDLSQLVSTSILPFEPVFFEQGFELNTQIQSGITVHGSEEHLMQVVNILLDNAQKYALPYGTVTVDLSRTSHRRCHLTVSNSGKDMSQEELKNIFTRFYRTDAARSRNGSFGLGLSIAK